MTHPGELLKRNGLYAGKELGQNFLSNVITSYSIHYTKLYEKLLRCEAQKNLQPEHTKVCEDCKFFCNAADG